MPDGAGDWTLGEVARSQRRLEEQLAELARTAVPRDLHEIAVGSFRVEIGKLDAQLAEERRARETLGKELDAVSARADQRFRAVVTGILIAVVAPIIVGAVLLTLSTGVGR